MPRAETPAEHQTKYEKHAEMGRKGQAVRRAKLWARETGKNVAILDYYIIFDPAGNQREFSSIEREHAVNISHGENMAHDTLAMSSLIKMQHPGKGRFWPGAIDEGPPAGAGGGGEAEVASSGDDEFLKIKPEVNQPATPAKAIVGPDDTDVVLADEEGNIVEAPGPFAHGVVEPETPAPAAPWVRPERPSGAVVGADGLSGPDPRVRDLILAGFTFEEACAMVAGQKIQKKASIAEDVPPTITDNPEAEPTPEDPGRTAELVRVVVVFKRKHYNWLADTVAFYKDPNITFQSLMNQIMGPAFANDPNRRARGRRDEQSFSGRREDLKKWAPDG